jgi:hypothetical protein
MLNGKKYVKTQDLEITLKMVQCIDVVADNFARFTNYAVSVQYHQGFTMGSGDKLPV